MRIAVVKETLDGERRVALSPEGAEKLVGLGYEVVVDPDAGATADFSDQEYEAAGAAVDDDPLEGADVVVSVQPLGVDRIRQLRKGAATISFLPVAQSLDQVRDLRDCGITAFALELVPRISRAQSMDALSSQALVAGYRSGIVAAGMLRRFFPLAMTSAGRVTPAQVVVLGAGVAGLQAIATARRLGAVVKAYDVREAAAEEIRSMGAEAIELDLESLEGSGGYAREMTEDRANKQRAALTPHVAAADALITTAAVPGRQAPMLVTDAMVEQMSPGSVVVDLAAEQGGNVESSAPGETVRVGHALVWGGANVPSQMPGPASRLLSTNIVNLVSLMTAEPEEPDDSSDEDDSSDDSGSGDGDTDDEGADEEDAEGADDEAEPETPPARFAPDFDDEVVAGCCVVHQGEVRHEPTRELLEEDS